MPTLTRRRLAGVSLAALPLATARTGPAQAEEGARVVAGDISAKAGPLRHEAVAPAQLDVSHPASVHIAGSTFLPQPTT